MSVDTLNADLAALRVPPGHAPACECRRCEEHAAALARVEAELARLREQLVERPTLEEAVANVNYWKDEAARLREQRDAAERWDERTRAAWDEEVGKRVAAEARCARLEQVADAAREVSRIEATGVLPDFMPLAEALARLDTPADSQEHDPETLMDSYIAADSQEDKT